MKFLIYCDTLEGKVHTLYKQKMVFLIATLADANTKEGPAFAKGLSVWDSFWFAYSKRDISPLPK